MQAQVLGSADFQRESGGTLTALKGLHLGPAAPSLQAFTALQVLDATSGCPPPGCLPGQLAKLSLSADPTTLGDQPFTAADLQHLTRLQHLALAGFTSFNFTGMTSPLLCLVIHAKDSLPRASDFPDSYQIGSVSLLGSEVTACSTSHGRFTWSQPLWNSWDAFDSNATQPLKVDLAGWLAMAQDVTVAAKAIVVRLNSTLAAATAVLKALESSPRASVLSLHSAGGVAHVQSAGAQAAKKSKHVDFNVIQDRVEAPAFAHAVRAEMAHADAGCMLHMLRLSRRQPDV